MHERVILLKLTFSETGQRRVVCVCVRVWMCAKEKKKKKARKKEKTGTPFD